MPVAQTVQVLQQQDKDSKDRGPLGEMHQESGNTVPVQQEVVRPATKLEAAQG